LLIPIGISFTEMFPNRHVIVISARDVPHAFGAKYSQSMKGEARGRAPVRASPSMLSVCLAPPKCLIFISLQLTSVIFIVRHDITVLIIEACSTALEQKIACKTTTTTTTTTALLLSLTVGGYVGRRISVYQYLL
jgi:hypothetical protein